MTCEFVLTRDSGSPIRLYHWPIKLKNFSQVSKQIYDSSSSGDASISICQLFRNFMIYVIANRAENVPGFLDKGLALLEIFCEDLF